MTLTFKALFLSAVFLVFAEKYLANGEQEIQNPLLGVDFGSPPDDYSPEARIKWCLNIENTLLNEPISEGKNKLGT